MKKTSLPNWETPSTETLPPPKKRTTEEVLDEWREKFPMRQGSPEWYMTTSDFIGLLDNVCESLPWMAGWDKHPGHPEDIATSVSMAVDTISATISALASRGVLKYRGQV